MKQKRATKEACSHYWIIEPAAGRVSEGTCRFCGERRQFANSLAMDLLGHTVPSEIK